jgi:hypothetical protein
MLHLVNVTPRTKTTVQQGKNPRHVRDRDRNRRIDFDELNDFLLEGSLAMNGLGIYLLHLVHTMEATVREDYLFLIGCQW